MRTINITNGSDRHMTRKNCILQLQKEIEIWKIKIISILQFLNWVNLKKALYYYFFIRLQSGYLVLLFLKSSSSVFSNPFPALIFHSSLDASKQHGQTQSFFMIIFWLFLLSTKQTSNHYRCLFDNELVPRTALRIHTTWTAAKKLYRG